jgi:diguanylate cyclase
MRPDRIKRREFLGALGGAAAWCSIAARKLLRRSSSEDSGKITVSIGVAEFQPGEAISALVERADRALYVAKRGGRNRTATELDLEGEIAA